MGVDLVEGDACGGDAWGSGVLWSCGVCTGGAAPVCEGVDGGCDPRLGLPANPTFVVFGGRPRLRGFPSSVSTWLAMPVMVWLMQPPATARIGQTYRRRPAARRHSCSLASDCA